MEVLDLGYQFFVFFKMFGQILISRDLKKDSNDESMFNMLPLYRVFLADIFPGYWFGDIS